MLHQKGYSLLLLVFAVFSILIGAAYFDKISEKQNVSVNAQESFKPPMYCMGMGTDCSDTPAPSLPPIRDQKDLPCPKEEKGFVLNFLEIFYSFFNPNYKSSKGGCSTETAKPVTPGNPVQPSTMPAASKIQFIDHKVVQVGGEEMSITVPKLNNIQPGDILVAMIGSDYAHVKTEPTGWIKIRQDVKNSGHADDLAMQSYYKIVSSNEQSTYTWNMVTERKDTPSAHQPLIAVDLYAFRGVDPDNPIFSSDAHGETADPRAVECPSVPGIAGGMLLCAYIGDDPGPITAPSSMEQTSNFEIAQGDTYAIAYEALTSDTETTPHIAQWDNPGRNSDGSLKSGSDFAHAIVLRPTK